MNQQKRNWSLTWNKTKDRKQLPHEQKLINFFNKYCLDADFQYETGTIKGKVHIQGIFTLEGPRQSKQTVLNLFSSYFGDYHGVSLSPTGNMEGALRYVTKEEGRVKGPFKAGKNHLFDIKISQTPLRDWQKDLYEYIIAEKPKLMNRKVIWVEDQKGNTGKSWFRKWLEIGQSRLVVRSLPVSNVDRLLSAVHIINKTTKVDIYTINLTMTRGEGESLKDLFSAVEQIKDGHVVDVMYGKYNRSFFEAPIVIIFTNESLQKNWGFIKSDRWVHFVIYDDGIHLHTTEGSDIHLRELLKSSSGELGTNQSELENLCINEPEDETL